MKKGLLIAVLAATVVLTGIWYSDASEGQTDGTQTSETAENSDDKTGESEQNTAVDTENFRTDSLAGITFQIFSTL